MHFTEMDDYVDGGVLANNPCDSGLTAIQNFCRSRGKKLDIACVVSLGCGNIPAEKLGKTDAHLYLTVGNIIKIDSIRSRVIIQTLVIKSFSYSPWLYSSSKQLLKKCNSGLVVFLLTAATSNLKVNSITKSNNKTHYT